MGTPSPWEHFTIEELMCKCGCGRWDMNHDFMELVVKLRKYRGVPMTITSPFRCPEHDAKVGTSHQPGKGPHTTGHAIDSAIKSYELGDFLYAVRMVGGFTGVGINLKEGSAPNTWFVHLDNLTTTEAGVLRPNFWTY